MLFAVTALPGAIATCAAIHAGWPSTACTWRPWPSIFGCPAPAPGNCGMLLCHLVAEASATILVKDLSTSISAGYASGSRLLAVPLADWVEDSGTRRSGECPVVLFLF